MPSDGQRNQVAVTVAAYGPTFGYPQFHEQIFCGETFNDQGPALGYEERRRVTGHYPLSATYGQILDEAAAKFGVSSANEHAVSERVAVIAFRKPEDDREFSEPHDGRSRWHPAIRVLDAQRNPSWAVAWAEVQVGEAIDSRDAGLLCGDPLSIYFWPVIPQGGFDTIEQALQIIWSAWQTQGLDAVATGALAVAAGKRVREALTAVRDDDVRWWKALRRPQDLVPYLDEGTHSTGEIARRMRLPEDTTSHALLGMGYVEIEGTWKPGGDPAAALLRNELGHIERAARAPTIEELAERVRAASEATQSK